jgi:hypothetical protein
VTDNAFVPRCYINPKEGIITIHILYSLDCILMLSPVLLAAAGRDYRDENE